MATQSAMARRHCGTQVLPNQAETRQRVGAHAWLPGGSGRDSRSCHPPDRGLRRGRAGNRREPGAASQPACLGPARVVGLPASPRPLVLAAVAGSPSRIADPHDRIPRQRGQVGLPGPGDRRTRCLRVLMSGPAQGPPATVRLKITGVRLGSRAFDTDRGAQSLPAWLVSFVGVQSPAAVLAVSPIRLYTPPGNPPRTPPVVYRAMLGAGGRTLTVDFTGLAAGTGPVPPGTVSGSPSRAPPWPLRSSSTTTPTATLARLSATAAMPQPSCLCRWRLGFWSTQPAGQPSRRTLRPGEPGALPVLRAHHGRKCVVMTCWRARGRSRRTWCTCAKLATQSLSTARPGEPLGLGLGAPRFELFLGAPLRGLPGA
jgi:hypothetical protein